MDFPSQSGRAAHFAHCIAIVLTLLVLSPGRLMTTDTELRRQVARSLWQEGSVFTALNESNKAGLVRSPANENRGTTFYGIGQSLLLIPFDMAGYALAKVTSLSASLRGQAEWLEFAPMLFLYAPLCGLLFFLIATRLLVTLGFSPERSRLAATLVLFGTTALVYSVQILQEELPIACCLGLAAIALLEAMPKAGPGKTAFFAGLFLALPLLFRLNSLFGIVLVIALAADAAHRSGDVMTIGKRLAPGFLAGVVAVLCVHFLFSYLRFGSLTSSGYSSSANAVEWRAIQWSLAWATLFGGGKGFVTLSPLLLLSAVGLAKERRWPIFSLACAIVIPVAAIVYSRLTGAAFPDGSESWGSRFFTHTLILLVPGVALFLERFRFSGAVKTVVALSLAMQLLACWAPDALESGAYPGETMEARKTRMLVSAGDGQLARRLRTFGYSLTGNYPESWLANDSQRRVTELYVPNFWGVSFWKRLEKSPLGSLCLALWLACLAAAVAAWVYVWRSHRITGSASGVPYRPVPR